MNNKYTEKELMVIKQISHSLNYDTLEANLSDNATCLLVEELVADTGYKVNTIKGILGSLEKKNIIFVDIINFNQKVIMVSDFGLREYYRLFENSNNEEKEKKNMVRYQNRKTGKIGVVIEENPKTKTVTLEFTNDDGSKKHMAYVRSSLSKSYKRLDDEEVVEDTTVDNVAIEESEESTEESVENVIDSVDEAPEKEETTTIEESAQEEIVTEDVKPAEPKAKKEKKARKPKKEDMQVKQTIIDLLDKGSARYTVVGKRIRLQDEENKNYAYILSNRADARVYIKDDHDKQYQAIADIATDNKYAKSKYNKTATIEYSDIASRINKLFIKK